MLSKSYEFLAGLASTPLATGDWQSLADLTGPDMRKQIEVMSTLFAVTK